MTNCFIIYRIQNRTFWNIPFCINITYKNFSYTKINIKFISNSRSFRIKLCYKCSTDNACTN